MNAQQTTPASRGLKQDQPVPDAATTRASITARPVTFEMVEDYTKKEDDHVATCERTGARCCCSNYF